MLRHCSTCKQDKPFECFSLKRENPTGRDNRCKECSKRYKREWRQNSLNRAKERMTRREWYYERGGKEIVRANTVDFRKRTGYPGYSDADRQRARQKTRGAIRSGKLIPRPCQQCGATPTHAHHDDYSKPLDVRWLCQPCHHAFHYPTIRALGDSNANG